MVNYIQFVRNIQRYVPMVEAKSATYVFNPKGVYDFKQLNPVLNEAFTDTFRGVEYPVLEFNIKKSERSKGSMVIKDGYDNLSTNIFRLEKDTRIEDFFPKTDGCIKRLTYEKDEIDEICEKNSFLGKTLAELTLMLKNPKLEVWFKERNKFSIGNIVIKDGDKVVTRGYFSKEKNQNVPIEKYHFVNEHELISGWSSGKRRRVKKATRLPEFFIGRLWLLDKRSKEILKLQYGIGCSPKSSREISKKFNITASRIREIIVESKQKMEEAKTYFAELKEDLNNLGHILSDEERFKIYKKKSGFDINKARIKIKNFKLNQISEKQSI